MDVVVRDQDVMGGLAKGLRAIEAFTSDAPRLSIAQVAAGVGLDRATARRCLLTLVANGYATHDGKFFELTPRVLRLGTGCLAAMPLPTVVQPYLDRLSEEVGQSTSVAILDEWEIVYVARASQRRVMSISLGPGSRLPAYCTSMGRVLLAGCDDAEVRRRLALRPLAKRTVHTLVDIDLVAESVRRARVEGHAAIDQEVELGLRSLAVPLLGPRKQVVAALNIGLAAGGDTLNDVVQNYLPALLAIQHEMRGMLR